MEEWLGWNTTTESGDFARFRSKSVKVRLEKIFGGGRNLLSSNPIRELRFPTNRLTERPKMNSTADLTWFRLKSVGVRSKNFSSDDREAFYSQIQSENSDPRLIDQLNISGNDVLHASLQCSLIGNTNVDLQRQPTHPVSHRAKALKK